MPVQTSVTVAIEAPLAHVFEVACKMDARELAKKHGLMPGVVGVEGHAAPWSATGQVRHLKLSDNSSVDEELVAFTPKKTFAYSSSNFTGILSLLIHGARGEWHFTQVSAGRTKIDWTYFFFPNGPVAEPVLWFIVKFIWPGYLRAALERVKSAAEQTSHEDRHI